MAENWVLGEGAWHNEEGIATLFRDAAHLVSMVPWKPRFVTSSLTLVLVLLSKGAGLQDAASLLENIFWSHAPLQFIRLQRPCSLLLASVRLKFQKDRNAYLDTHDFKQI